MGAKAPTPYPIEIFDTCAEHEILTLPTINTEMKHIIDVRLIYNLDWGKQKIG